MIKMAKKHIWRIKKEYFYQLKNGEKKLEVRVGYQQIKKARKGDIISFENYGKNEFRIKRIAKYNNLREMLTFEEVENVLPGLSKNEALKKLQKIYPQNKERLGVYVFELINLNNKNNFKKTSKILK